MFMVVCYSQMGVGGLRTDRREWLRHPRRGRQGRGERKGPWRGKEPTMERGAISHLEEKRGYGRLVRLGFGGTEIGFTSRELIDCEFAQLHLGNQVDFEVKADLSTGLHARWVRIAPEC